MNINSSFTAQLFVRRWREAAAHISKRGLLSSIVSLLGTAGGEWYASGEERPTARAGKLQEWMYFS